MDSDAFFKQSLLENLAIIDALPETTVEVSMASSSDMGEAIGQENDADTVVVPEPFPVPSLNGFPPLRCRTCMAHVL